MRNEVRILGSALSIAALGALGCSSSGSPGSSTSGGTTTTTTTTAPQSVCATDPRAEAYAVGLDGASSDGALKITFMDSDPAPPAKGNNTFVVKVTDSKGNPVNGATIATVAYMPDHGHYSSI